MVKYALKHKPTNTLLEFYTSSNGDAEFCNDVSIYLSLSGEGIWLVNDFETAKKTRTTEGEWFNAGFNTPMNRFKKEDLEVVEVELKILRSL